MGYEWLLQNSKSFCTDKEWRKMGKQIMNRENEELKYNEGAR